MTIETPVRNSPTLQTIEEMSWNIDIHEDSSVAIIAYVDYIMKLEDPDLRKSAIELLGKKLDFTYRDATSREELSRILSAPHVDPNDTSRTIRTITRGLVYLAEQKTEPNLATTIIDALGHALVIIDLVQHQEPAFNVKATTEDIMQGIIRLATTPDLIRSASYTLAHSINSLSSYSRPKP